MSAEIVILPCVTRLNLPVGRVLDGAKDADLESVVVLGYTKDGKEYFASSYADGGNVMWLMRRCERKLLDIADELERD